MNNDPVLVILIPGFPADENDSTCLPAHQNLVRQINQQYPNVPIIILSFQYPFQKKEYDWNGNTVIAFGGKNKGGIRRRFLWQRVRNKLNQLKKEFNIKAVLSFWAGETAFVGARWASRNGIKHFCWLMGQDVKRGNRYIKGIKGNEWIALSDFLAEELKNNSDLRCAATITLGVSDQQLTGDKRNIDILCAGSLIPLKQFEIAISTANEMKKEFPVLRMMIVGEGPERERLANKIKELHLEQNVLLAGEKEHDELLALMRQSRLFLHPSAYEGFGIVCLEALAAGTPVISLVKPMRQNIPGWHVAESPSSMTAKAFSILKEYKAQEPFRPYPIEETAKKIMGLLGF